MIIRVEKLEIILKLCLMIIKYLLPKKVDILLD